MKRVMLVIGLILLAAGLVAAGPKGNGGPGNGRVMQARTGTCDNVCDGPDRIREQLQLHDGSCMDDAVGVPAAAVLLQTGDRIQERLHDGSCDLTGEPDRTRDRVGRPL